MTSGILFSKGDHSIERSMNANYTLLDQKRNAAYKDIKHCMFNEGKKVSKGAKIKNRYNQVPHLTQDTNGKVTHSQ